VRRAALARLDAERSSGRTQAELADALARGAGVAVRRAAVERALHRLRPRPSPRGGSNTGCG